jgi:hypothetical protein
VTFSSVRESLRLDKSCMRSNNENPPCEQIGKPQRDPSGAFSYQVIWVLPRTLTES